MFLEISLITIIRCVQSFLSKKHAISRFASRGIGMPEHLFILSSVMRFVIALRLTVLVCWPSFSWGTVWRLRRAGDEVYLSG